MPQFRRSVFRIAALGAAIAALLLSGCGRKGPLDPPPASSMQQAPAGGQSGTGAASGQPAAQAPDFGPDGKPLAPKGQKKKLPGDWLID